MLNSVPNIVSVCLPSNYRRPGVVRPAIVTSIADAKAETLNLVVFIEPGDRTAGQNNQETQFFGAVPRTETNTAGGWFAAGIEVTRADEGVDANSH